MLKNRYEHHQVKIQAMDALSNLVMKFSPMKQFLLENGAIEKLVQIAKGQLEDESSNYLNATGIVNDSSKNIGSGDVESKAIDGNARFASLWVLKNLLHGSDVKLKKQVLDLLGWDYIASLAFPSSANSSTDQPLETSVQQEGSEFTDVQTQWQALEIIGNLCSTKEEDIEFTILHLGKEKLMDSLESVIWQEKDDSVLLAVASILINIATGRDEHRRMILDRPNLLDAILYFMVSRFVYLHRLSDGRPLLANQEIVADIFFPWLVVFLPFSSRSVLRSINHRNIQKPTFEQPAVGLL